MFEGLKINKKGSKTAEEAEEQELRDLVFKKQKLLPKEEEEEIEEAEVVEEEKEPTIKEKCEAACAMLLQGEYSAFESSLQALRKEGHKAIMEMRKPDMPLYLQRGKHRKWNRANEGLLKEELHSRPWESRAEEEKELLYRYDFEGEEVSEKKRTEKLRRKEERRVQRSELNQEKALSRVLRNCALCYLNTSLFDRGRVLLENEECVVLLPESTLFEDRFECMLTTKEHYESEARLSGYDDVLQKLRELKHLLLQKYEDMVFVETVLNVEKMPHLEVHCFELSQAEREAVETQARMEMKLIGEVGEDGEKRLIRTDGNKGGKLEKVLPLKGSFNYVHLNLSNRGGMLLLVDEHIDETVSGTWAFELLGSALKVDKLEVKRALRRERMGEEERRQKKEEFERQFK